jgi:DNA-binding MarR family transcriptional regulator
MRMDAPTKKIYKEFMERKSGHIGRLIKLTSRYIEEELERMWKEAGFVDIRTTHLALLANIDPEGINVNTLAEKAFTSKQAMSQILKELEELGYVESLTDPDDKRAKLVRHTPKGITFIGEMIRCIKKIEKHFIKILGKEKMNQLIDIQQELITQLYPNSPNIIRK